MHRGLAEGPRGEARPILLAFLATGLCRRPAPTIRQTAVWGLRECRWQSAPKHYCLSSARRAHCASQAFADGAHQFTVGQNAAADALPSAKTRLDTFLVTELPQASRAKLQAAIKLGHVQVNGQRETKVSLPVRLGDVVTCALPPPAPLEARPEDIPLEVVHEDDHLLVVDKAAGMVAHPSPGHATGTLVNALLHHCRLPAMHVTPSHALPLSLEAVADSNAAACSDAVGLDEDLEDEGEEVCGGLPVLAPADSSDRHELIIRPGIVHRLDKGTTGLLVVAKDDVTHAGLAQQFKDRTVQRDYMAIVLGAPKTCEGCVETQIGRDLRDRKRMAAFPAGSQRGRAAASKFRVLEELASGAAALVLWRLGTGRTHQIRVHARHIGHAVLGDDTYGGAPTALLTSLSRSKVNGRVEAQAAVQALARPALHARSLGFVHPMTGERLYFESQLPDDFMEVLMALRTIAPTAPRDTGQIHVLEPASPW